MNRLLEKGIAKGLTQGLEQGVVKGRVESIRKMMDNMGLPLEQAMRVLEAPQEEIPVYQEQLKNFDFFKS